MLIRKVNLQGALAIQYQAVHLEPAFKVCQPSMKKKVFGANWRMIKITFSVKQKAVTFSLFFIVSIIIIINIIIVNMDLLIRECIKGGLTDMDLTRNSSGLKVVGNCYIWL